MKVEYLALVISGLINPLFLVILTLAAMGYQQAILRIILLLMIPFCWVVFYSHPLYPAKDIFYGSWGWVLALFSGFLQAGSHSDWEECPWCWGRDYNCPNALAQDGFSCGMNRSYAKKYARNGVQRTVKRSG